MFLRRIPKTPIVLSELKGAVAKTVGWKPFWATTQDEELLLPGKLTLPDSQPRCIEDSLTRAVIPLSAKEYRDRYVNYLQQIRFGRLLEDLDSFAVYLSYKHNNLVGSDANDEQRAGFSMVTALVDGIIVKQPPLPTLDLHMTGYVSWVGKSSLEATMHVEQPENGNTTRQILCARFVMVAIDAVKRKSVAVTPLKASNKNEQAVIDLGLKNHQRRIKLDQISLFRRAPDAGESSLIHDLYLSTLIPNKHSFKDRAKPSDDYWMRDTSMKGLIICHPENRNMYSKIFGGFLMRTAYELAWAEAWTFSRTRPSCVAVDDIVFRRPVEVGSLLYLHQSIGYTDGDLLQTRVTAEVTDVNDPGKRDLANIFHFTFRTPLHSDRPPLPQIVPDSYGEAMLYLDSRRKLQAAKRNLLKENIIEADGADFE